MEIGEWEIRGEQEKKRESIIWQVSRQGWGKLRENWGRKCCGGRRGKGKWQNDKKKKTGEENTEARGDVIR